MIIKKLLSNFFGQNKNRTIFIGIDKSIIEYKSFLKLFHNINFEFYLYEDSKNLEQHINKCKDIIYILLVKNNIHITKINNDNRLFIFRKLNKKIPKIDILDSTNKIEFKTKIENFTLEKAYIKYNQLNKNLYVDISNIHGFGLFTNIKIKKSSTIFSLNGDIKTQNFIDNKNFKGEWNALENKKYLVRNKRTSYGFINHSKTPNCKIDKTTMNIISIKNIDIKDELLLDYTKEPLSKDYIDKFGKNYL